MGEKFKIKLKQKFTVAATTTLSLLNFFVLSFLPVVVLLFYLFTVVKLSNNDFVFGVC